MSLRKDISQVRILYQNVFIFYFFNKTNVRKQMLSDGANPPSRERSAYGVLVC